jgi:hypothetical protein
VLAAESLKGYNKCKDNDQAFISHKKGSLFPRKGVVDPYEVAMERKATMDDLGSLIGKIEKNQSERKQFYELTQIINSGSK